LRTTFDRGGRNETILVLVVRAVALSVILPTTVGTSTTLDQATRVDAKSARVSGKGWDCFLPREDVGEDGARKRVAKGRRNSEGEDVFIGIDASTAWGIHDLVVAGL
jgi:hypothetical protein